MSTIINFMNLEDNQSCSQVFHGTLSQPWQPPNPSGYEFEFSVIDGVLSNNQIVTSQNSVATFWYLPGSSSVSKTGDSYLFLWAYDLLRNASVQVDFAVTIQGGGMQQIPSPLSLDMTTTDAAVSVTAASNDSVVPFYGSEANTFQYWLNPRSGEMTKGNLEFPPKQGGFYIAIYSRHISVINIPPAGRKWPTIIFNGPGGPIFKIPGNSGDTINLNSVWDIQYQLGNGNDEGGESDTSRPPGGVV